MASFLLVGALVLVVLYKMYNFAFSRPPNFPPGPPRIPIFGSYLFLLMLDYNHLHKAVAKLCRFYQSNVIGFYLGPVPVIAVNDIASVREAVRNRSLDGKPDLMLTQLRAPDFKTRGLFFTQGQVWQDNRRFSLRHLRDFGYARRFAEFELDMQTELQDLLNLIRDGPVYDHEKVFMKDGLICCPKMFFIPVGNSLLKVISNDVLARPDQHVLFRAAENSLVFTVKACSFGRMFSFFPFLTKLFPQLSEYSESRQSAMEIHSIVKDIVLREWATHSSTSERHFLDFYFKEIKTEQSTSFCLDQLVMTCVDLFLPTFSTLSTAMNYMIYQWLVEPDTLTKIQVEIDSVVGRSRLPTLDDRVNLHYTEASLREILRLHTTIPSGFPHVTLDDTTLNDYVVPKGTFVVTGLQAAHWNEHTFKDALQFKPERFLDASGKLCLKKDVSLPFGGGRRLCAGETFSRNLLFLLIAALAQNYSVRLPSGAKLPDMSQCRTGIVNTPPTHWVKFYAR